MTDTAAARDDASRVPAEAWLDDRRRRVDAALDRLLPRPPETPPLLADAMRYSVQAGGKRLRPLLVLAAAEAIAPHAGLAAGDACELALPAACAIELIHTYSLVHDDLPAMDDDTLRRGRPTAHVVFGEGQAILSGDALHTEAFVLLAREPRRGAAGLPDDVLAMRKLRAVEVIAVAAGSAGMAGGQSIDLQAAAADAPRLDRDALRGMHERKTGALIRASALAGAVMAGAPAHLLDAVDVYGSQLGLAFQIVDDILDVEGESQQLGKTAGKDSAAGKPTYPAVYGLDESRRLADGCVQRALAALAGARLEGALPAIARWVAGRSS